MAVKKSLTIICAALLLLVTGCRTQPVQNAEAPTTAQPSDTIKPVRVSGENADAAEPAVGAAPDGTAFVAWVEHRENREADVMLAHVDGEGKMKDAPVRVNQQPGAAT